MSSSKPSAISSQLSAPEPDAFRLGPGRLDRGHVNELPVLDLQDDGRLDGVALLVDGDRAGDAREILRRRKRVANLVPARRARPLHRVREDPRGVVAERSKGVRNLVVLGLVVGHELLHRGRRIVDRVMVREVTAVQGFPADLPESRRVPAVPADQRYGDAELAGLARDRADLGVITGHVDAFGIGRLDLGELGAEVRVSLAVRLLRDDLATETLVRLAEESLETDGIVVPNVGKDR